MLKKRPALLSGSAVTIAVLAVTTLAACGSTNNASSGATSSAGLSNSACHGTPINIMTISTLSGGIAQHPEIPASVKAAAHAINTSCADGRPINVITCDDKYDPNASEACARQAISDKVIAVVGQDGDMAEYALPVLKAAGIPEVGFAANGNNGLTLPNAYSLGSPVPILIGEADAAVAMHVKSVTPVVVQAPSAVLLVGLLKSVLQPAGIKVNAAITTPENVTSMTAAAAQAQSSGGGAYIEILTQGPLLMLLNALYAEGDHVPVISSTLTVTPSLVTQWGPHATNGVYLVGSAIPLSVTSNPGVQALTSQLKAIGFSPSGESDWGTGAWAAMTLVGKLLKGTGSKTVTPAILEQKLNSSGPQNIPPMQPFNFSKLAYPTTPGLSKQRIYSSDILVSEVANGSIHVVSNGFVSTFSKFSVPQLVKP
jgi:ABC-type branched-subunit amino acid transport system substrate-binding protein